MPELGPAEGGGGMAILGDSGVRHPPTPTVVGHPQCPLLVWLPVRV